MTNQVNNTSSEHNPVGRFMVAVGAVIANPAGEILLIKRDINAYITLQGETS